MKSTSAIISSKGGYAPLPILPPGIVAPAKPALEHRRPRTLCHPSALRGLSFTLCLPQLPRALRRLLHRVDPSEGGSAPLPILPPGIVAPAKPALEHRPFS